MRIAWLVFKVLLENSQVRVVEMTLAPGEKNATHTHAPGWYYVTRPGTMKIVFSGGKTQLWEAKAGEQGWHDADPPHTCENVGPTPVGYVLVEVKSAAKK
jgi:quercetin dioxygenase-like cupin family protein